MNNTGKVFLFATVAALFFLWKDRDDDGDDPPGNNNIAPDEPAPTASKPIQETTEQSTDIDIWIKEGKIRNLQPTQDVIQFQPN